MKRVNNRQTSIDHSYVSSTAEESDPFLFRSHHKFEFVDEAGHCLNWQDLSPSNLALAGNTGSPTSPERSRFYPYFHSPFLESLAGSTSTSETALVIHWPRTRPRRYRSVESTTAELERKFTSPSGGSHFQLTPQSQQPRPTLGPTTALLLWLCHYRRNGHTRIETTRSGRRAGRLEPSSPSSGRLIDQLRRTIGRPT